MTHATIYYIDPSLMAVEFEFDATKKNAVARLVGAQWQKENGRWNVPVARLGDVVRIFFPDVTIDYEVLRARDEQLRRMFRQYRTMGVVFALTDGKVTCDHAVLNSWFAANANVLHAQALAHVLSEDAKPVVIPPLSSAPAPAEDRMLTLVLKGVKNAQIAKEKKDAMIANLRRNRVAA